MNTKLISSKLDDFFFIKFPIWIPLAYYFFINSFPSYSLYALIFLLLVGEIHFGITFAFFFDRNYTNLFINDKYIYVFWPITLIVFVFFFGYFFSLSAVLFLILLFNFYHVNRQSVGIFKIYMRYKNSFINNIFIYSIYFFSFLLCFFGVLKFIFISDLFFKYEDQIISLTLMAIFVVTLLLTVLMLYNKEFNLDNLLNFATGIGMFLPIFFCDRIIDVFAMGVAMHYVQYIYIAKSIMRRKYKMLNSSNEKNLFKYFSPVVLILYLLTYAILMIYFSNLNLDYKGEKFGIYIIPIIFQLLHFYFDMFFWRFSNEHTQKNLSPYLFLK